MVGPSGEWLLVFFLFFFSSFSHKFHLVKVSMCQIQRKEKISENVLLAGPQHHGATTTLFACVVQKVIACAAG